MSTASAARACSTSSIRGLQKLNALGYGRDGSGLTLNLVYNPQGPSLPPPQAALEADYRRVLGEHYGIVFNQLFTLANMPIKRFGSTLVIKGEFDRYLELLQRRASRRQSRRVMCRNLISVDWRGFVYDCDFNQMLGLPLAPRRPRARPSVRSARRGPRRQSDPRRRPLLRLHRRPGIELRRRAVASGRSDRGRQCLGHAAPLHHRAGARRRRTHRRRSRRARRRCARAAPR